METLDMDGADLEPNSALETETAKIPAVNASESATPAADISTTQAPNANDAEEISATPEPAAAEPQAPAAVEQSSTSEGQEEAQDNQSEAPYDISDAAHITTSDLAVTEPLRSRLAALADLSIEANGADEAKPERNPLTPGKTLAGYTIVRLLRETPDGPIYLAEAPTDAAVNMENGASAGNDASPALSAETQPWRYIAYAIPEENAARIEAIVNAAPQAPGLLAPIGFERIGSRAYVVGVELPGAGEQENQPAAALGTNERLRPVDALTACAQIANSVSALHRSEIAHLHVTPDQIILYDGRVYLAGVENATPITSPEEASDLYTRDANFLARTAGALGGANDVTLWDYDSSAQRSLREIAARGAAGTFTNIEEVAEAASLALQVLVVAGASLGADARTVRLRVTWGATSSVGRLRSENQDAWSATLFDMRDDAAADSPLGVFLVADGMGGEAHGEVASRFVARIVSAEMAKRFLEPQTAWPALAIFSTASEDAVSAPQVPLSTALEQAVKEANRRTRAFGARISATTGSTVTALAIAGARVALAHLGDSRAYLLRDGQLLQLTEDHSLLARLEQMNHPMLEDPNFMVPRSVLYRSIGQEDDVTPDMLQFVLAPGDRIMLCSDGLWDEVNDAAIQQTLADASDPSEASAALVALANRTGGHDNSTAVVLFVHAEPHDDPFMGVSSAKAASDASSDGAFEAPEAPADQSGDTPTEDAASDAE